MNSSRKIPSLLKLLSLIDSGRRLNSSILASELGTSVRTVSRYLMYIQQAGYPVYFSRACMSYRFADGFRLSTQKDNNCNEFKISLDLKRQMLQASVVGIASFDETGQCIYCNDAICKIWGGTQDQMLTQNYTRLDSWISSGMLIMAHEVIKTGVPANHDCFMESLSGSKIWLNCTMSRFERGGKPHLMLVAQDISQRRQTDDKLRLFKALADTSREAIAISDPSGLLLYINPAHERLFGRALAEAITCNYRDFYPPESVEILNREVAPALAAGKGWEGVLPAIDKDGRQFQLWERADTIFDEQGQILCHFGLMHKITQG